MEVERLRLLAEQAKADARYDIANGRKRVEELEEELRRRESKSAERIKVMAEAQARVKKACEQAEARAVRVIIFGCVGLDPVHKNHTLGFVQIIVALCS